MKRTLTFCFIMLAFISKISGQEVTKNVEGASIFEETTTIVNEPEKWSDKNFKIDEKELKPKTKFKPNPTKAVIYSAIFPGMGQIYNRKYWKLPLIYSGFVGLSYGISWNGGYYNDYSAAYRGASADNWRSESNFDKWGHFVTTDKDASNISESDIIRYQGMFKRKKDFYRRNRDLCIIGGVALYAVCIVDAYVDAQLFDFDISEDLSLKVEPAILQPNIGSGNSFGVQCSFNF